MSGRSLTCAAAALCLFTLFSADPSRSPVWDWISTAWSALTVEVSEPPAPGETPPEGWLIDPNG